MYSNSLRFLLGPGIFGVGGGGGGRAEGLHFSVSGFSILLSWFSFWIICSAFPVFSSFLILHHLILDTAPIPPLAPKCHQQKPQYMKQTFIVRLG